MKKRVVYLIGMVLTLASFVGCAETKESERNDTVVENGANTPEGDSGDQEIHKPDGTGNDAENLADDTQEKADIDAQAK